MSRLTRRRFIQGAVAAPAVLGCRPKDPFQPGASVFPLGVASGDPDHRSVVLWTRLAPDPLVPGGGLPARMFPVLWEVARDPNMTDPAASGLTMALPQNGHAVHAVANGLEPDRHYWYRFRAFGEWSPIGRTRTFPHPNMPTPHLRFAHVSCQDYQDGFFTAYADLAQQDLDFVVHVGDYIYEGGPTGNPIAPGRVHDGPEIFSVDDYRARYALYRMDPDLQAAHARFPFIATWDDHELDNNYAADIAQEGAPFQGAAFLERRRNAYRAYAEAMPMRPRHRMLRGSDELRIYRRLSFGRLADFHVLDTRQYRSDQPTFDGFGSTDADITPADAQLLESIFGETVFDAAGILDPSATMLGATQEAWLADGLRGSRARWNVLAQQVMVMPWNLVSVVRLQILVLPGLDPATRQAALQAISTVDDVLNMDGWDGAPAARDRLMGMLGAIRPSNPIVLTGDVHSAWSSNLFADVTDPSTEMLAAEFVCTSISSTFQGRDPRPIDGAIRLGLSDNPHVEFYNALFRGYCLHDVDENRWQTEYRGVGTLADRTSPDPDALIPVPGKPVETDAIVSIRSGFNQPGSAERLVTEFARVPIP